MTMNDEISERDRPQRGIEHHEAEGFEGSHLGAGQITALALASQTPAVALATVPFLLVVTAGNGSWLGALMAAVATACVGVAVIVFARRYVVTGSIYSYMSHVFGPWARHLVGTALLLGYITLLAGVLLLTGAYAGSFLISIDLVSELGPGVMTALTSIALAIATALAYRGLDASISWAVVLTVITLPLVVVITVASASTRVCIWGVSSRLPTPHPAASSRESQRQRSSWSPSRAQLPWPPRPRTPGGMSRERS